MATVVKEEKDEYYGTIDPLNHCYISNAYHRCR